MNAAFALSSSCVIASLVAGALAPSCGAAGQDRAKVEREVYGAVLKDSRVVGLLQFGAPRRSLVMSETVVLGDQGWLRPRMSAGRAGGLRQLVPGAANATVEDLERVTAERLDLTRLLADMDDVTLISPSEVGDIFAGRDGWER